MFEPAVNEIVLRDGTPLAEAWWGELLNACGQGVDVARRVAARHRGSLDDESADRLGVRLIDLLDLDIDPPGSLGVLASTADVFAGPQTIAAAGRALRQDLDAAAWKIEAGFAVLTKNRGLESAVQTRLCSRDAWEVEVLVTAHQQYRGWTTAMMDLLGAVRADAPLEDMERYFALNLQDAMVWGTRFRGRELLDAVDSPLRGCLARMVWATYSRGQVTGLFRVDPEGDGFLDAEADPYELPAAAQVGVPHRAEMSAEQLDAWGATFADFEIVSLFPQLDRELLEPLPRFPYTDVDRDTNNWELLRALHRDGWTRRPEHLVFHFPLRGASLSLDTAYDGGESRTLCYFRFTPGSSATNPTDAKISFSEALGAAVRVLDTFAPNLV